MAYSGNLTCRDCGLTFTSSWGSRAGSDEYRCAQDHSVQVDRTTGEIVSIDDRPGERLPLEVTRGRCPLCATELATGLLPCCPVCGGRDHEVLLAGISG